MSKSSKASLRKLWACRILNAILLIFPILFYVYLGYSNAAISTLGAICLTGTIVLVVILLFLNLLLKLRLRCIL